MTQGNMMARMQWVTLVHLLVALLEAYCIEVVATSSKLPDIYWNASNPIFRIDNTDHIIDVNRGNNNFEYDQVNLICPFYPRSEGRSEERTGTESYLVYNVSKEEYDSCIITNTNARIIAVCDQPYSGPRYFTITFRSFTPQPGGLEFKPGQDYYFISTSTGSPEGLYNKQGGSCASNHMKVTFKVCCESDAKSVSRSGKPSAPNNNSTSAPHHRHHHHRPHHNSVNNKTTVTTTSSPESRSRILSALTTPESTRSVLPASGHRFNSSPLKPSSSSRVITADDRRSAYQFNFVAADATTSQSVTSASTPFWWRPHYTKLPSMKHGREDAISGASDQGSSGSDRSTRKGRAWLLVVAAIVAVGVACLIFCGLGFGRRLFIREKHKETVIHNYPRI